MKSYCKKGTVNNGKFNLVAQTLHIMNYFGQNSRGTLPKTIVSCQHLGGAGSKDFLMKWHGEEGVGFLHEDGKNWLWE